VSKNELKKVKIRRGERKGKGEGVTSLEQCCMGEQKVSDGLGNPFGLIIKHIFALFKVSISAFEYKCTKFSTCVIDLLVLMFSDKEDL
jgi:hypothetical protein